MDKDLQKAKRELALGGAYDEKEVSSFTHYQGAKLPFTAAEFNREFIIRYYPDSTKLSKPQLIGFTRMCEIIGDKRTVVSVINWAMNNKEQTPRKRFNSGYMLSFFRR